MRVGFVGLGTMGRPMAAHVLAAGHDLVVWDVAPAAVEPLVALGAGAAADLAALAAATDVVLLSLPGPAEIDQVVLGAGGLLGALAPGAVVVDLSTNSVEGARRLAVEAAARGVAFVDAPVSGGRAGAEAGTLSTMVGCEPDVFAAVQPLLACFAPKAFHVGPSGAGAVAKLVNNQIFLSACVLVQEAFVLGAKAGLDPSALLEILKASSAGSVVGAAPTFLARRFDDVRFRLSIAEKDVAVALASARALGVDTPVTEAAHRTYRDAVDGGLGASDFTATLQLLEDRAGATVPRLVRKGPAA